MLKGIFIKMCLHILIIAFCLHFSLSGHAEQSCDEAIITSTEVGNREYDENWRDQYQPTIVASSSIIAPGHAITLYVASGGMACPDYSWSVSGKGYSLNKDTTKDNFEVVTLTSASGT